MNTHIHTKKLCRFLDKKNLAHLFTLAKYNKAFDLVPKKYINVAITGIPGVSSAVTKQDSDDKTESEFRPSQTLERHTKVEPIPV